MIVRNLEAAVKRKLESRAARHGRSVEEEVREILRNAVKDEDGDCGGFGTESAKLFKGIEFDAPIPELRARLGKRKIR